MGLSTNNHINRLMTISVITKNGFHCSSKSKLTLHGFEPVVDLSHVAVALCELRTLGKSNDKEEKKHEWFLHGVYLVKKRKI
jgi:hypothetical protein